MTLPFGILARPPDCVKGVTVVRRTAAFVFRGDQYEPFESLLIRPGLSESRCECTIKGKCFSPVSINGISIWWGHFCNNNDSLDTDYGPFIEAIKPLSKSFPLSRPPCAAQRVRSDAVSQWMHQVLACLRVWVSRFIVLTTVTVDP